MNFSAPTPVLRVFDEAIAKAFYVDFLGFTLDWEHRYEASFPLYFQVSQGNCVLHLSEHHGDGSPGASVRVSVDDLNNYQKILLQKQYKGAKPDIIKQPWNTLEMNIKDPFYNKIVFYENLEEK